MKRNEKILAFALLCIVVGYFGWPMIDALFLAPIRDARAELARVEKQVVDTKYEWVDLKTAEVNLEKWSEASLPGDPTTGQRLYMQWLDEAAGLAGLDVTVGPGRRASAGEIYTAVQVVLEGKGTFSELTRFLETFRRVNLLHRIVSLQIKPTEKKPGKMELPLEIVVEGLSLKDAEDRSELFPKAKLADALDAGATSISGLKETLDPDAGDRLRIGEELLAVVEIKEDALTLERGVNGTKAAAHEAEAEVELYPSRRQTTKIAQLASMENPFAKPSSSGPKMENSKPNVHLAGTMRQEGIWEAWLWNGKKKRRITLREGEPFEAAGVSGTVKTVLGDQVVLQWDGGLWEMGLGETLEDLVRVGSDPDSKLQPVEAPTTESIRKPVRPRRFGFGRRGSDGPPRRGMRRNRFRFADEN